MQKLYYLSHQGSPKYSIVPLIFHNVLLKNDKLATELVLQKKTAGFSLNIF